MLNFYELLGTAVFYLFILFLILSVLGLVSAWFLIKKKRYIFTDVLLFMLDTFYFPSKWILNKLGIKSRIIDDLGIDIRNARYKEIWEKMDPKDKIVVLPQCLRNPKCPARMDPLEGIQCKKCGLCRIKDVKELCEEKGIDMYIVSGGSFVEKIIQRKRPKAALGVACPPELFMGMQKLSTKGLIVRGISLGKTGCYATAVDFDDLIEMIKEGE